MAKKTTKKIKVKKPSTPSTKPTAPGTKRTPMGKPVKLDM